MNKKFSELQPGDFIWDMHNTHAGNNLWIEEKHQMLVNGEMVVRTEKGVELIEDVVRQALGNDSWRYHNKMLTVLKINGCLLTCAWAYDGRNFGMVEVAVGDG